MVFACLPAVVQEISSESANVFKTVHWIFQVALKGASATQPVPTFLEGRRDKGVQTVHGNKPIVHLTIANRHGKTILTQRCVKARVGPANTSHCIAHFAQILLKTCSLGLQPAAVNEDKVQINQANSRHCCSIDMARLTGSWMNENKVCKEGLFLEDFRASVNPS